MTWIKNSSLAEFKEWLESGRDAVTHLGTHSFDILLRIKHILNKLINKCVENMSCQELYQQYTHRDNYPPGFVLDTEEPTNLLQLTDVLHEKLVLVLDEIRNTAVYKSSNWKYYKDIVE